MIGGVATLLYFIVLVLLFLLVKFHQQEVTAAEGGLMINFGNVDEAAPGADMALNDEIADAQPAGAADPESRKRGGADDAGLRGGSRD